MMAAPIVTGISPKEGPPGTKVTLRGENLGRDQRDLISILICGVECIMSAEWNAPNKIKARTGLARAIGEVIITTKSGGCGTCTVTFKGISVKIGPLQESNVWIDESKTIVPVIGRNRPSSPIMKVQEDPLGISDEGANTGKFSEEELQDLFPDGSGNVCQENFDPVWFLLENHHGTKFEFLKDGLTFLKNKSSHRSEGPLSFVKANLTTFMDCLDTLEAMHRKLLEDETSQKGSSLTDRLELLLAKSNECANVLFQEVLGRKDRADATRNALSVLQRFKFLFNLPCSIDKNIKKGDYDLVINDYLRARSLFGQTEVPIFKKVYEEVEKRISDFRKMLHSKLLKFPSTLEEQKKLIRYLVNLEQRGDPAWECLIHQQKWLTDLMLDCKEGHLSAVKNATARDEVAVIEDREQYKGQLAVPTLNVPTGSFKPLGKVMPRHHSICVGSTRELLGGNNNTTSSQVRIPQKVQFVEELTATITETFPDLWKLGQAYFAGQLVLKESGEQKLKVDTSKHAQFKEMIQEVINLFTNLLRAAFLPVTLENLSRDKTKREIFGYWPDARLDIPGAWLPHCVRYVRSCVMSLTNTDLPGDSLDVLQDLAFDMRAHCMTTLLKSALDDIHNLHTRETWDVESSDEFGGTTQLPVLFENIINDTIQHLHEVVMKIKEKETEIFTQRTIQKEATSLCTQLLQGFATVLEELALHGTATKDRSRKRSQSLPMIYAVLSRSPPSPLGDNVPCLEKRLIIMLSNCNNTIEHIIPRLIDNFEKHGYPEMNKVFRSAQMTFDDLDEKLFEAYIEEKSNPIVGVLEQNMYAGRFDWKNCSKPKGVRTYIKQALLGLISVHAEVYAISPGFVPRVMYKVVQAVCEELLRLVQCVTAFSNYGAIQARLELISLWDAVELYKTNDANAAFQEALNSVQEITTTNDKKLFEDLLNQFKANMKFHLLCLRKVPLPNLITNGNSYA
ncbi:exocyst complex component 2-like [Tubulanus polymorphus]|uniref:exocyst complex component 2-like n=1 Tax=Tubulanus polymorphus TaxID=672921 RepID=UPI003DA47B57